MAMMWKNWNKADKTLLAAAAIFCFALCLNIQYKDNVYAKGFLFCAEAALVGGIAIQRFCQDAGSHLLRLQAECCSRSSLVEKA